MPTPPLNTLTDRQLRDMFEHADREYWNQSSSNGGFPAEVDFWFKRREEILAEIRRRLS